MKILTIVNAAIEILAGLGMLFATASLPGMESAGLEAILMARMYGAAALSVGVLSLLVMQKLNINSVVHIFTRSMVVFHLGVGIVNTLAVNAGNENALPVAILHGLMGLAFLYFVMQGEKGAD